MKRYVPKRTFAVGGPGGVPRMFKTDYIDPKDGLQGYPELPSWLPKEHRKSFETIEAGPPVEQATAAPGEKRTRKARKPKAQTVGVETASDDELA